MGLTVGAGKVQRAEKAEEDSQDCLVAQLDLCILLSLNMYTCPGAILHSFCAECPYNGIMSALVHESPRNAHHVYHAIQIFIRTCLVLPGHTVNVEADDDDWKPVKPGANHV